MALFSNMALKATQGSQPFKYLGVINDSSQDKGYLEYSTNEVLSQNAKFAVEYAHSNLFHIRSCMTNKYWVRSSTNGNWIVAQGVQAVVDKTSWTCTLFRMDIDDNKKAKFYHVQSGRTIRIPNDNSCRKMFLSIDPTAKTEAVSFAIDYDTLVVLPKFVAFKGSNGLYYKNYSEGNDPYGRFSVKELGDQNIVCETRNTSDGQIRLRAVNSSDKDMFWSYSSPTQEHLIVWNVDLPTRRTQIFDAIRVNKNVVALRCLGNNKFCKRADVQHSAAKNDRLVANADGVVRDAYLEVVEPVFSRTVNVYEFNLDKARIYNVTLIYSHEHVWDNYTGETQGGTANGTITTTKSRTYSNNITISGSVTTTFETGIPYIAKGEIQVTASGSYAHQWDHTTEESEQIGDTFNVVVKPMKTTRARGVATKGKCDVPFAYVQKDFPTSGGLPIVTRLRNGVFTGANAYSFHSDVRYEELPPHNGPAHLAPTKCFKRPLVSIAK